MQDLNDEQHAFLEVAKNEIISEAKLLAQDYKIKLLLGNDLAAITKEFADNETPKLVKIAEKFLLNNQFQIIDLRGKLINIVIEESCAACINLLNS